MRNRRKAIAASAAVLAVAAGGTGLALAGGGDDDATEHDAPITGPALDRAEAAALRHTGEGSVTETEVGDEESYYQVEVTREDGTQTDVQLNRDFDVVGQKSDGEEPGAEG